MNQLFTAILAAAVFTVPLASLAQSPQSPQGDAKAGQTKNAMCIGCHGIKGYQASFPEVYKVPMISGQSAAYMAAALQAYKKGERKHPTMRSIAATLTDQDIADLTAYYSGHGAVGDGALPDKPSKEPDAQVQALLNKANCASCHGANFSKPIDPTYPKIGGQHADYLFVALKAYKMDTNPSAGRVHPIMGAMAKQYTNAELKLMANYLASLEGDLKVVSQSRFR
jgi:cytochrome c553